MKYNGKKITLPIKPLSINACFTGRRFKTKASKAYDEELQFMLPKYKIEGEYYFIKYKFYIKSFKSSDLDNLIKQVQDNLVKKGIIKDDRFIKKIEAEKFYSKENKIEIEIGEYKEL